MQRFFLIALILTVGGFASAQINSETDTHIVKKGETLYSLSKTYNTTVSNLLDLNPAIVDNKLQTGSSIKVHIQKEEAGKKVTMGPPQALTPIIYQVTKGETLYSIAKRNNNNLETLRLWNDLKTDDIKTGQKLIVAYGEDNKGLDPLNKPATNLPVTAAANSTIAGENQTTNPDGSKNEKHKQSANNDKKVTIQEQKDKPAITNETKTVTTVSPVITKPSTVGTSKEEGKLTYVTEKGIATWSKGNNDDGQFYALHPTAPVGTMVTVKNIMNSRSIQVKVIGKLPGTPENQNVMIKLSASAAKALNVLDDKFLATLNYMGYK